MAVVKTPLSIPALKSCNVERVSFSSLSWSFLPIPKPRKQTANIGVTPIRGAAIPEMKCRENASLKCINLATAVLIQLLNFTKYNPNFQ